MNAMKEISVSLMGYKTQTLAPVNNKKIDFILLKEYISLKEVRIRQKQKFLTLKADTLSFTVEDMTNAGDRVIGDILKKIPGIETESTGKIYFNGKPIKNLYINGDNLLDDKYSIATTAIPYNMVEEIQIIQNDQPVKVLSGIVLSETPSINLKIKSKFLARLAGRVEGGINPSGGYKLDIYTLLINKKVKTLNSFNANNTGSDLEEEITPHNITDYLKALEHESPVPQADIKDFAYPPIAKEKYFFNKGKLINTNILLKDKKQTEFKSTISLLQQEENDNTTNSILYFLPYDTVSYHSETRFYQSLQQLNIKMNIKSNLPKKYVSNTIESKLLLKREKSFINNSNELINEHSKLYNSNISNDFNFINVLKAHLIFEINSFNAFYEIPQTVSIFPGIFPRILNNNISYLQDNQKAIIEAFFSNTSMSLRKIEKSGSLNLRVKYIFQNQRFTSLLYLKQMDGTESLSGDIFTNKVPWTDSKLSFELNKNSTIGRLTYHITLPLNYERYRFSNHTYSDFKKNKLIFNPQLNLRLKVGAESDISLSLKSYTKSPAPSNNYDGNLLQSYRAFSANYSNIIFPHTRTLALSYNFKKNIQLFFANVLVSISKYQPQQIFYRNFENDLQFWGYKNYGSSYSSFFINTRISKYLFKLHTSITAQINVQQNNIAQLQNNNFVNFLNTSFSTTIKINSRINSWLNASYTIIHSRNNSKDVNNSKNKSNLIVFTSQTLEVNSSFTSSVTGTFAFDAYHQKTIKNNYSENIFTGAGITYKINKLKTDLSLTVTNLLNQKEYIIISKSNNVYENYQFRIRPRMLMLKLFFNF